MVKAAKKAKREKLAREMTMRERIAMEAMAAIVGKVAEQTVGVDGWTIDMNKHRAESIALGAADYADALIARLEERK